MGFILAGVLAAAVSWVGNRTVLHIMGTKVIVVAAPLLEETAKSGAAVLTGSSLVLTHGVFGLVEAIYDAWSSWPRGFSAALASLAGHVFYGCVAYFTWQKQGVFWSAVMSGYTVHMLWNLTVMKFIVRRRKYL